MVSIVASRTASGLAALGVLLAVALPNAQDARGYPLILVEQGVSVKRIGSREVFVVRDGSVLNVYGLRTPGTGSRLHYCPNERIFVAPEDQALYDREGRYVDGPGTGDMDTHSHRVDPSGALRIGKPQQRPRSNGEISGEAAEAYLAWRADPDTPRRFCQAPVPPVSSNDREGG